MSLRPKTAVVGYVAAPHRGYLELFRSYAGSDLYIFGKDIINEFPALVRNLPGPDPEDVATMIASLNIFTNVYLLTRKDLDDFPDYAEIVMPDEDVSRAIAEKHFSGANVRFDGSWRLRWHWDSTAKKEVMEDNPTISKEEFDQLCLRQAGKEAERSSDWWRQVGAVLVKDHAAVLVAHNAHFPSEQNPYVYGDPRSNFSAGASIEVSTALHAEVAIISEAAKRGISTAGADLYVTTFPCPPCAYACANAGLRRLFYAEGYSLLEGGNALKSRGVELIKVQFGE